MTGITAVVVVALAAVVVLAAALGYVLARIDRERGDWRDERRFLTDRAIARHTGEILALDKAELRREIIQ